MPIKGLINTHGFLFGIILTNNGLMARSIPTFEYFWDQYIYREIYKYIDAYLKETTVPLLFFFFYFCRFHMEDFYIYTATFDLLLPSSLLLT